MGEHSNYTQYLFGDQMSRNRSKILHNYTVEFSQNVSIVGVKKWSN